MKDDSAAAPHPDDMMTAGPAICYGHSISAGWHSISCTCSQCITLDRFVIGPTSAFGYAIFTEVNFDEEQPWYKTRYYTMRREVPPEAA